MRGVALIWLAAWLFAAGCARSDSRPAADRGSEAPQAALTKVALQLNWFPEAEHGGYYAAAVDGDFRQAALDVEILPGGKDTKVVQDVATGRVLFGVANADNILFARAQQAPVVAVMAPLQTSPRCLLVHRKAGIADFRDLHDLTIAASPGAAFVKFLRKRLPLTNVQFVPYTGNVQQFLLDERIAQQGYVFSEPFIAKQNGADPQVLMLADLGFNPYTSLLFTTEDVIDKQPDLVRRVVAASIRGWREYVDDPAPVNARIHELNPAIELAALAYGAEAIAPLVQPAAGARLGEMTLERWQTLTDQLVETGALSAGEVDPAKAFTVAFLPD